MTGEQILAGLLALAGVATAILSFVVRERGRAQVKAEVAKEEALRDLTELKAEIDVKKLDPEELHERVQEILRKRLGPDRPRE